MRDARQENLNFIIDGNEDLNSHPIRNEGRCGFLGVGVKHAPDRLPYLKEM